MILGTSMIDIGIFGFVCLAILSAWLLLQIELAEGTLILIILAAASLGLYWTWIGGWHTETAKGVTIFASLVVGLGFVRLAVEKLFDRLARKRRHVHDQHQAHDGP
jgi:hypothetical protein